MPASVPIEVLTHRCRTSAAGCRITSIQKFLGHKQLSTTMIYARVHDQTAADDYYLAMRSVEKRLELIGKLEENQKTFAEDEREQVLALTAQFTEPEISLEARLTLVAQVRLLLMGSKVVLKEPS